MNRLTLPRGTAWMLALLLFFAPLPLIASEKGVKVQVLESFIELRTGPGRAYPRFQAVEKGQWITILKRRTDWFLVRTHRNKEGWVSVETIKQTLSESGDPIAIEEVTQQDAVTRSWESGFLIGDLGGANTVTVFGDWRFTPNLAAELSYEQILGHFSDSKLANISLLMQPAPEWRFSPYFSMGAGRLLTHPGSALVKTEDRNNETVHVGVGLRTYITRNFVLRADYNKYVVLTSRNEYEHLEEWKLGFSVFF